MFPQKMIIILTRYKIVDGTVCPLQKLLTEPYAILCLCWENALRNCTYPLQKLLTEPYAILCWESALRNCTYPYTVRSAGPRYNGGGVEVSAFSVACSVSCFSRGRDTPLSPFKILKGQTGCRKKVHSRRCKKYCFLKENAQGGQTDVRS